VVEKREGNTYECGELYALIKVLIRRQGCKTEMRHGLTRIEWPERHYRSREQRLLMDDEGEDGVGI
jgi:hypothetical protein